MSMNLQILYYIIYYMVNLGQLVTVSIQVYISFGPLYFEEYSTLFLFAPSLR